MEDKFAKYLLNSKAFCDLVDREWEAQFDSEKYPYGLFEPYQPLINIEVQNEQYATRYLSQAKSN